MEKQELIVALQQLQAELAQSDTVDSESLDRLQAITAELESRETVPAAAGDEDTHSLRDMLLRFEAEHPHLSEILGRIADGLAGMGI